MSLGPPPSNKPSSGNGDEEPLSPDEYLYFCGLERNTIDWYRLMPVCERVITRLIADEDALRAHVRRLESDGNRHNDLEREAFLGTDDDVFLGSFQFDPVDANNVLTPVCLILIMSDAKALLRISSWVRHDPMQYWKEALAIPRVPFLPGDRDDRAAARLYELAKLHSHFVGR